jgi:hypothetical protein
MFLGLVLFLMYVLCLVVICRWWFCQFDLLLVCLRLCCCCCCSLIFFFGFIDLDVLQFLDKNCFNMKFDPKFFMFLLVFINGKGLGG